MDADRSLSTSNLAQLIQLVPQLQNLRSKLCSLGNTGLATRIHLKAINLKFQSYCTLFSVRILLFLAQAKYSFFFLPNLGLTFSCSVFTNYRNTKWPVPTQHRIICPIMVSLALKLFWSQTAGNET